MDILTALDHETDYSTRELQLILGAWVMSTMLERGKKIQTANGHIEETDYRKQSIYSLLYSLYRTMGEVRSDKGDRYELTFNTWGYTWPKDGFGPCPTSESDPQRFGRNAYTGLWRFKQVEEYVAARDGKVHVVEMGCGTGAGAHHIAKSVLPKCTYEAFDMQAAAIKTARRKHVPELGGRLVATRADCTKLPLRNEVADFVAVCETHVTEVGGQCTTEDQAFFGTAHRILKPGGFLVWGNAIPDSTWQPCLDYMATLGMKVVESRDVTKEAIDARDQDRARVDAYVDQCLDRFMGFKIPLLGRKKRLEAAQAMKNFYRNPATNLYNDMVTRADTYRVVCVQKAPAAAS